MLWSVINIVITILIIIDHIDNANNDVIIICNHWSYWISSMIIIIIIMIEVYSEELSVLEL